MGLLLSTAAVGGKSIKLEREYALPIFWAGQYQPSKLDPYTCIGPLLG